MTSENVRSVFPGHARQSVRFCFAGSRASGGMADAGDLKSPGVIPRAGSSPASPSRTRFDRYPHALHRAKPAVLVFWCPVTKPVLDLLGLICRVEPNDVAQPRDYAARRPKDPSCRLVVRNDPFPGDHRSLQEMGVFQSRRAIRHVVDRLAELRLKVVGHAANRRDDAVRNDAVAWF